MNPVRITGGCQCGAVRYALHTEIEGAHLCHCRMCQKQFGSYFAPWGSVPREKFELTRGTLAIFQSSLRAERGFCRNCGTPLTFGYIDGDGTISVSLGSLDHPERVVPRQQNSTEARLPWFAVLPDLPGRTTAEWGAGYERQLEDIRASSRQHPDHDTSSWTPHPSSAR